MATERQIAAARANGAKSRGPRTPEGKRNSARNSRKHGLYARCTPPGPLETAATRDRFQSLLAAYEAEFQPATPLESTLVSAMARSKSELERLWSLEASLLSAQMQTLQPGCTENAETDPVAFYGRAAAAFAQLADNTRLLDLLGRHESRLHRQFSTAFNRLLKLRERKIQERTRSAETEPAPSQNGPAIPEPALSSPARSLTNSEPVRNNEPVRNHNSRTASAPGAPREKLNEYSGTNPPNSTKRSCRIRVHEGERDRGSPSRGSCRPPNPC
jgi:hypothetical protein